MALMTPVTTLTDGLWVAITKWIPAALASWARPADGILHLAGRHHHKICQLVDDDHKLGKLCRDLVRRHIPGFHKALHSRIISL